MSLERWQRGETPLFNRSSPALQSQDSPESAHKHRHPRFLGDSGDEHVDERPRFAPRGIDALFDLQGVTDDAPTQMDEDAFDPLARFQGARSAGTDVAQPKKRLPRAKLDEDRLLGARGMPRLLENLARFETEGRGREHEDLQRLLGLYRLWAHQMYPKYNFHDAMAAIEKICRKRSMQRQLNVWRIQQLEWKRTCEQAMAKNSISSDEHAACSNVEPEDTEQVLESDTRPAERAESNELTDEAQATMFEPATYSLESDAFDEEEAILREVEQASLSRLDTSFPMPRGRKLNLRAIVQPSDSALEHLLSGLTDEDLMLDPQS